MFDDKFKNKDKDDIFKIEDENFEGGFYDNDVERNPNKDINNIDEDISIINEEDIINNKKRKYMTFEEGEVKYINKEKNLSDLKDNEEIKDELLVRIKRTLNSYSKKELAIRVSIVILIISILLTAIYYYNLANKDKVIANKKAIKNKTTNIVQDVNNSKGKETAENNLNPTESIKGKIKEMKTEDVVDYETGQYKSFYLLKVDVDSIDTNNIDEYLHEIEMIEFDKFNSFFRRISNRVGLKDTLNNSLKDKEILYTIYKDSNVENNNIEKEIVRSIVLTQELLKATNGDITSQKISNIFHEHSSLV